METQKYLLNFSPNKNRENIAKNRSIKPNYEFLNDNKSSKRVHLYRIVIYIDEQYMHIIYTFATHVKIEFERGKYRYVSVCCNLWSEQDLGAEPRTDKGTFLDRVERNRKSRSYTCGGLILPPTKIWLKPHNIRPCRN